MDVTAGLALLRFETPGYLALFALLPLLVVFSFRSLAGLGVARRVLALLCRCLVLTCMILALAGAQRVRTTDELAVIFLLDRSHSVPRNLQEQAFEFVRGASDKLRRNDRLGVVAFDGQSAIEQLPMGTLAIGNVTEPVAPDQTNLAAGLRMSMALFPPETTRRLVVLSDGNDNVGDVFEEMEHFRAAGVPVDVVPLRYAHRNEVGFERLSSPPSAAIEETINLQMILRSEQPVTGQVLLYQNDQLIDLDESGPGAGYRVKLEAGPTRLTIPVPLRLAGVHRFNAVFEPDDPAMDTIVANNVGRAFTVVAGQGRLLILTTQDDLPSAEVLKRALETERLVCDLEVAGENPLDQERLLGYSAVMLSNVPANYLSDEDQKGLAVYVRDLGGGLIMVGGDESFGAGGWMGSPVEEVMPVSFDVKAKKQIPRGALILVMHACEIPRGNYWGERVAVAAIKTLASRDLVGVLSYQWLGAEQGYWVVPLQEIGDKTHVIQQVLKMQMGDMPSLEDVMKPAVDALIHEKTAAAKHMIVISDFDPVGPSDSLLTKMKKNRVSCSTVAIGFGSHMIDVNKADSIAKRTGGKSYTTTDYSELPRIFIKESRLVRRSLINETPFTPRLVNPLAATVAGLGGEGFPQLEGYVVTTPKPLAEVPLVRPTEDGNDPILANWQVGLGKTVAFTSGMWPKWGANWAAWPRFSKLWAQIARWASRQSEAAAFDVTTAVQGGKGRLRIDAVDKNAAAINFMSVQGNVVTPPPHYNSHPLRLTQTGPGRYEAEFDAQQAGSYIINLAYRVGEGEDAKSGNLQTGVSVAYAPEYRDLEANLPLLNELAQRTGGRLLEPAQQASVFDPSNLPKAESRRSIWEDLVRWMLVLFLLDVAVRRIALNPLELARRARQFIEELAGRQRVALESAAVLSTLKDARERLMTERREQQAPSDAGPAPHRAARYEARKPDEKITEDLTRALGGATEQDAPVVARPTRKTPATSEADYTSRLLQAKRRARDDMKRQQDQQE